MDNKINIFKYLDYRELLREFVKLNSSVYGYKAKLALAASCQRSFISQVLGDTAHLTQEQGFGLCEFWSLDKTEREYFLNLLGFAKSGERRHRSYLKEKIDQARADRENLVKRISDKVVLPDESAAIFYSNWYYLGIQILLSIPGFRAPAAIAQRLDLSEALVTKALADLERLGLSVPTGQGDWQATQSTIHVPRDSQFNSLNHSHWRNKAVQNSFLADEQSVHYTSVCSISKTDAEKLKQLVFQLIDDSRKIVAPSPEEDLFCLTCDWFRV